MYSSDYSNENSTNIGLRVKIWGSVQKKQISGILCALFLCKDFKLNPSETDKNVVDGRFQLLSFF